LCVEDLRSVPFGVVRADRYIAGVGYGNENWEFDEHGLMARRIASINDVPIEEVDRKFHWPLGRRPDEHPGLSALGL